jgi:hypothetical protein
MYYPYDSSSSVYENVPSNNPIITNEYDINRDIQHRVNDNHDEYIVHQNEYTVYQQPIQQPSNSLYTISDKETSQYYKTTLVKKKEMNIEDFKSGSDNSSGNNNQYLNTYLMPNVRPNYWNNGTIGYNSNPDYGNNGSYDYGVVPDYLPKYQTETIPETVPIINKSKFNIISNENFKTKPKNKCQKKIKKKKYTTMVMNKYVENKILWFINLILLVIIIFLTYKIMKKK